MSAQLLNNYALVSGLLQNYFLPVFTPVKRGRRPKGVIREICNFTGTKRLEVSMFEQLDAADQDLFLSILSFCGDGEHLVADEMFDSSGHIKGMTSIKIETTGYALLKRANRSVNGYSRQWLVKALDRLAKTSLKFTGEESVWRVNLLNYSFEKDRDGGAANLNIWVNPIAALVFTGSAKIGYVRHSLVDRFSLKTEAAKILHGYLVGIVKQGQGRRFDIETLVNRVYTNSADTERADRQRKTDIKKALREIDALRGWRVEFDRKSVVVRRYKNSK